MINNWEDWEPVDEEILEESWENLKDTAEIIQKDLSCPDEVIAKMLKSVAASFEDDLDNENHNEEEGSWEEEK